MVLIQSILTPVMLLLLGVAFVILGIVANNAATVTDDGTSERVLSSFLATFIDYEPLVAVSNSSDTAFCTVEEHKTWLYNMTNYDDLRVAGATGAPEYHECMFIVERKKCYFSMELGVANKGGFDVLTQEPGFVTATIPDEEEVAALSVDAQQYYSEWELSSSTCPDDANMTLLNLQYVRYVGRYNILEAGIPTTEPSRYTLDSNDMTEESILWNLFVYVWSSTYASEADLQTALDDAGVSIPAEHFMWLVNGSSPTRPALLYDHYYYYYWYGGFVPSNLSLAFGVNFQSYLVGNGPFEPIPFFLDLVDQLSSSNASTVSFATDFLANSYSLSPAEATEVAGFLSTFLDGPVFDAALALVEAGSGPTMERTFWEVFQTGNDPLIEALGYFVVDYAYRGVFSADTFSPHMVTFMPNNPVVDRGAAVSTTLFGLRYRDLLPREWVEFYTQDYIDNSTVTTADDGHYRLYGPTYGMSDEYFSFSNNSFSTHLAPNGLTDNDGIAYPRTVAYGKEKSLVAFSLFQDLIYPILLKHEEDVDVDGLELARFTADWDAILDEYAEFPYSHMLPFSKYNRVGAEEYWAARGNDAPVLKDIVIDNIDEVEGKSWDVYFDPVSGLATGFDWYPTTVVHVNDFTLFPNHNLPAGWYIYGGSESPWTDKGRYAQGRCGSVFLSIAFNNLATCELYSGVQQASDAALASYVTTIVFGAILIVAALALLGLSFAG
uniref:Uncharacterized protein n=1 Tax=Sexangularia sp. CB-2014 TaxID=1486929 RepID=A0A7S1V4B1_9EUKA